MKLIVTRPVEDSVFLAAKLLQMGHEPVTLALLAIVPRTDITIPEKPWAAICLTSANAVRTITPLISWLTIPVVAIGGQSSQAALRRGFQNVSAQGGDVNRLSQYVCRAFDASMGPILYLSGSETSGDLEGKLRNAGYDVHRAIVYDALKSAPEGIAPALDNADGVLLYSPRTAKLWFECIAAIKMEQRAAQVTHFCLSENVARQLPAKWPVRLAQEPTEDALLAMLAPPGKQE